MLAKGMMYQRRTDHTLTEQISAPGHLDALLVSQTPSTCSGVSIQPMEKNSCYI